SALTVRGQLRLEPALQVVSGDRDRVGDVAIGVELVEGVANELVGSDRRRNLTHVVGQVSACGGAIRQRREVRLQGVEDAPEAPHARDVVLDDVAVEQELACTLLDATGATL